MPHGAFVRRWRSRVKPNTTVLPIIRTANCVKQFDRIIIGVMVPESLFRMAIEVLAVKECDDTFYGWFFEHRHKNNPAGAITASPAGGNFN